MQFKQIEMNVSFSCACTFISENVKQCFDAYPKSQFRFNNKHLSAIDFMILGTCI